MKKLLALLLSVTMLCGSAVTALAENKDYPQRFYDVPKDHWAFEYIAELVDRGVIAGYEDGSFRPSSTVTRAEFAKIMVCAASVSTTDNNVYFTDMQGHWAVPYVNAAENYLTAYSDNTYRPDQAAVREDVTMAMVKLKGYDVSNVDFSYLSGFTDTDSISNNIKAYVAVAVEKGLISGFEDNTFRGQGTLTRAEAATLLWKAFQYGSDNKVIDMPTEIAEPITAADNTVETTKTTPKPTAKPIPKSTEKPEPTEEPTPEPTEKPYKVDTFADVDVDIEGYRFNKLNIAYDGNGTIYYSSDNIIHRLTTDGDDTILFEGSSMDVEEDFSTYKFSIQRLCYADNGKLYFVGEYTPKTEELTRSTYILDGNSGDIELYGEDYNYPVYYSGTTFLSNGYDGTWINSPAANTATPTVIPDETLMTLNRNGNIIAACVHGIYEYDYSTATKLSNSYGTAGISKNGYAIEKDNAIIIRSFDGTTEIKYSFDDCAIKDQTRLNDATMYKILYLTPNNNIIFYDTNAKAFRIISENK